MVFLPSACFRHSNPNDSHSTIFLFFCFNKRCLAAKLHDPLGPHFSIKEGSELLGKHVASKLYGFLFDSLQKLQAGLSPDRRDIYFTVTLCESLTSVDK